MQHLTMQVQQVLNNPESLPAWNVHLLAVLCKELLLLLWQRFELPFEPPGVDIGIAAANSCYKSSSNQPMGSIEL